MLTQNFIKKLCKKLSTILSYLDSNLKYVYFAINSKFLFDDLMFLAQIKNSEHMIHTRNYKLETNYSNLKLEIISKVWNSNTASHVIFGREKKRQNCVSPNTRVRRGNGPPHPQITPARLMCMILQYHPVHARYRRLHLHQILRAEQVFVKKTIHHGKNN